MRIDGIFLPDVPVLSAALSDDLVLVVQRSGLLVQSYQNLTSTYYAIAGEIKIPGINLPTVRIATSQPTDELVLIVENSGLAVKQIGFNAPVMSDGSKIAVPGIGIPSVRFSGTIDGDEYVLAVRANNLCLIPIPSSFSAGALPTAGQTFYASLKTSLVPEVGTGGPTWSRATAAWRFNDQGYLRQIPSGCAEFGGARLVTNLCPTPSNTLAVAGTKTVTLTAAATLQFSMGAGTGTATFSGTGGATGTLAAGASRVSVNKTVTAGTFVVTASVADLVDLSIVDVTGRDASYVPEYVSVGVLSTPYHGAGVDGSKYFATDWQGAPIAAANLLGFRREAAATNNLMHARDLRATGDGILSGSAKIWAMSPGTTSVALSNGNFATNDLTGWTNSSTGTGTASASTGAAVLVGTDSSNRGAIEQALSTVSGKTYTVKFDATITLGNIASGPLNTTGQPFGWTALSVSSTGSNLYYSFTATATTTYLKFWTSGNTNGSLDNISVTESSIQAINTTGLDGIANTATTLTATATDAIILQPTSGIASAARCASAYVERVAGTGTISFTQDGGSTWTDITSQLSSSTYSRVQITATLANPSVGFKISTSGDAIAVDCVQNEAGSVATSPIVTTTTTVNRNADSLTYQTSGNWSDTAGTAYLLARPVVYSGGAVGSATNGLLLSASNSGATAYDGTNAANGPTGTPGATEKLALAWGSSTMSVASSGLVGTPGTYDGAMGLSSIGVGVGAVGYFGDVAIYNYKMTDAELQAITT